MVLSQSFEDYEIIVVDDGSSDGTAELLQERISRLPGSRSILKPMNEGIAAARNSAVAQARGQYTWFVDCDDEWSSEILREMVESVLANDSDIAVVQAVRSNGKSGDVPVLLDGLALDRVVGQREAVQMLLLGRIRGYLWNKLILTSLLRAHSFPPLSSQSDLAGVISILADVGTVSFVGQVLYTHLVRPGSITNSKNPKFENLEYCWRAMHKLAEELRPWPGAELRRVLTYVDYWTKYVAMTNTLYRLGSDQREAREQVRRVRRSMHFRDLATIAHFDTKVAVLAALMLTLGPMYGGGYQLFRRLRR